MLVGSDCNNKRLRDAAGVKRGDTVGIGRCASRTMVEHKPPESHKSVNGYRYSGPTTFLAISRSRGYSRSPLSRYFPSDLAFSRLLSVISLNIPLIYQSFLVVLAISRSRENAR